MTPEEAIKAINAECDETLILLNTRSDFDNALAEAIKALEEIQKYREIGTVTECREAMEKYRPKKCAIESCPDHTHYKCPTCMAVHMTVYKPNGPKIGWIPRFCKWCGQAIDDENLEGTE